MNINKIVLNIKNINRNQTKSMALHLLQNTDISHAPWASQLINFLEGSLNHQPHKVVTLLHHTLKRLHTVMKKHKKNPQLIQLSTHVINHSNLVKSHISKIKHITELISHSKNLTKIQKGSGKKRPLKKVFKGIVSFLKGETKVKPSQVLNGVSEVAKFCATTTRALKLDTATVVFDKIHKATSAIGDFFKQRGAGRVLEGGSKSGASCDKKNPARKICCKGSGKKKKTKGGSLKAGGALKAGGSLSAGGSKQSGGYLWEQDRVKAEAVDTYKKCKRSMKQSGHRSGKSTKTACANAVYNYGKHASNYTGSALEMREKICPRRSRGIE